MSRRSIIKTGKLKRNRTLRTARAVSASLSLGIIAAGRCNIISTDIVRITYHGGKSVFDVVYATLPMHDASKGRTPARRKILEQSRISHEFACWEVMPTKKGTRLCHNGVTVEQRVNAAIDGYLSTCIRYEFNLRLWCRKTINIVRYAQITDIDCELQMLYNVLRYEMYASEYDYVNVYGSIPDWQATFDEELMRINVGIKAGIAKNRLSVYKIQTHKGASKDESSIRYQESQDQQTATISNESRHKG